VGRLPASPELGALLFGGGERLDEILDRPVLEEGRERDEPPVVRPTPHGSAIDGRKKVPKRIALGDEPRALGLKLGEPLDLRLGLRLERDDLLFLAERLKLVLGRLELRRRSAAWSRRKLPVLRASIFFTVRR